MLLPQYLPRATPLDPAEDPPGSIDPLGTLSPAERIADILFPGFTARMWRPRFLTFAAVAALVLERAKTKNNEFKDNLLALRLGFERLFVSSIVRMAKSEPETWGNAIRRLPGSALARAALDVGDIMLDKSNFLKGQAINGPFGVIARLARHLGVVDEDNCLGRNGEELLRAWSSDEELPGLLDEYPSNLAGQRWLNRFVQETIAHVVNKEWRSSAWSGWKELSDRLRPDNIGRQERQVIHRLMKNDDIRARCMELLSTPEAVSVHQLTINEGRGEQERRVLMESILPLVAKKEKEEDEIIEVSIKMADAYETISSLLETAFNCLLWALTRRGGQVRFADITADRELSALLETICRKLPPASQRLREIIEKISSSGKIFADNLLEPLEVISTQALEGAQSSSLLLEVILGRHEKIQKAKEKSSWIERVEQRLVLMPGYGLVNNDPPNIQVTYLHPFRILNVYSFLNELGLVKIEVSNEEK